MMKLSAYIDRYEEDYVVLLVGEDEEPVNFPRRYLPDDAGEGDYLSLDIAFDAAATEQAAKEAEALLRDRES